MRPFRWARQFEAYDRMNDVPARAKRTEVIYWLGILLGSMLMILSVIMIFHPELWLHGLFLCLIAINLAFFVNLWAHIRVCTYQIIKEIQFHKDEQETHKG